MSLIFQDPSGSLDPRKSAGSIVGAPLRIHQLVDGRREYNERVEQLFRLVRMLRYAVGIDLDIGLHTRGMKAEEAVEELVRRVPIERRHAEAEVVRLCQEPSYGLCDAVGRRELLALREACESRDRGGFTLRGFHD